MNKPLNQLGQTPRHGQSDKEPRPLEPGAATNAVNTPSAPPVKTKIRDLKPGEPPPESSAGS